MKYPGLSDASLKMLQNQLKVEQEEKRKKKQAAEKRERERKKEEECKRHNSASADEGSSSKKVRKSKIWASPENARMNISCFTVQRHDRRHHHVVAHHARAG